MLKLQIPILQSVLEMYENAAKLYDEGFLPNFVEFVSQNAMKYGLCHAITEFDSGVNCPEGYIYITKLVESVARDLLIPVRGVYIAAIPDHFVSIPDNFFKIRDGIGIRIKVLKYMIENKIV